MPWAHPGPGHTPSGAGWRWWRGSGSDAGCRRPAGQAALRAVAPELAEFERSRRDDLAAVARQWDDMVRRAAAHPEFPAG
ncbi:hypothetical protein COO58_15275 [Micromonospora sp. WMMA1996]|uniref:hypothetical protein n=1 Tax=Micromonospora sp. WMMA1996 TaxID=2039878 RepID=UPI000BF49651|nr:hypothetical protein [Micromonospora sp. WMMA1996]PGH45634.1 hypothetical protein COO58_15275 [Micromonospora sp. WMMA1996]